MRKVIAAVLSFVVSSGVLASAACLKQGDCFEHEGRIYDLRTPSEQLIDRMKECDSLIDHCLTMFEQKASPELSPKEFQQLLGSGKPEYFIPIDIRDRDMLVLAAGLSLGTIVFANDRDVMDYVQSHKTPHTETVTTIGNILGREAIVPLAAGSYFVGAVLKNGRLKQVGIFTIAAGIATQIVTEGFKKSFERVRPNSSDSPYEFFEDGNNSFFSGHTSGAFSLATVIAHVYRDKPAIPYLAYGIASLTAYARMADNKHWASDVLMGALAGHLVTKIFLQSFDGRHEETSGLVLRPSVERDSFGGATYGVDVTWRLNHQRPTLDCSRSGLEGNALLERCIQEAFN